MEYLRKPEFWISVVVVTVAVHALAAVAVNALGKRDSSSNY